ncbi:MAG: hypothetical protein QM783_01615 [Phycisphaerales bacterium]
MADWNTITIVRCGGAAEHWRRVIERCEKGEGRTLKTDGPNAVLALPGENGAAGLVVKRWKLDSLGARIKSALRASRAWRHWKGAERLTKCGLHTASCYAIARSTGKDGATVEWLVMDRLQGKTLLQHMADRDLTVKQEHTLAAAVGTHVRMLLGQGFYNRDGKPSNLIVTWPPPADIAGTVGVAANEGLPQVSVIDCVAIRRTSSSEEEPPRDVVRSLANLYIEPLGCGCVPRITLLTRTLQAFGEPTSRLIWKTGTWRDVRGRLWRATSKVIRDHGDPTPKVNPLA